VFGVNDHDSARLVSDLLGQETVVFQTMSRALDPTNPAFPTASNTRPARC
jgi:type IV secretion system protein VirD4